MVLCFQFLTFFIQLFLVTFKQDKKDKKMEYQFNGTKKRHWFSLNEITFHWNQTKCILLFSVSVSWQNILTFYNFIQVFPIQFGVWCLVFLEMLLLFQTQNTIHRMNIINIIINMNMNQNRGTFDDIINSLKVIVISNEHI